MSNSESDSSVGVEYSRDRCEFEFYDHFANQEEPMVTNDCIGNYMFLAYQNSYDIKIVLSSFFLHLSEDEVTMIDDKSLITRKQEGHQSSNRGTVMAE